MPSKRAGSGPAGLRRPRRPLGSGNPRAGEGISLLAPVMRRAGGRRSPLTEPGHLPPPHTAGHPARAGVRGSEVGKHTLTLATGTDALGRGSCWKFDCWLLSGFKGSYC